MSFYVWYLATNDSGFQQKSPSITDVKQTDPVFLQLTGLLCGKAQRMKIYTSV